MYIVQFEAQFNCLLTIDTNDKDLSDCQGCYGRGEEEEVALSEDHEEKDEGGRVREREEIWGGRLSGLWSEGGKDENEEKDDCDDKDGEKEDNEM